MEEFHGDIDWSAVFERMLASKDGPLSHLMLARHLRNAGGLDPDRAWQMVYEANDEGELLHVTVGLYPGVRRRYYLVPRPDWDDVNVVVFPLWDYVIEEDALQSATVSRSEIVEYVFERNEGEVPYPVIDTIMDHADGFTPLHSAPQPESKHFSGGSPFQGLGIWWTTSTSTWASSDLILAKQGRDIDIQMRGEQAIVSGKDVLAITRVL